MKLTDALYNWIQMKIVADARPDDGAAKDTRDFFESILREDHHVTDLRAEDAGETVRVFFVVEGETKKQTFHRETAEYLLTEINANPKYNNQ